MGRIPSWALWSIIAAGVLLSPVLAFLMALAVAVLLGLLKKAGLVASLAMLVACTVAYLGVRRVRATPARRHLGDACPSLACPLAHLPEREDGALTRPCYSPPTSKGK